MRDKPLTHSTPTFRGLTAESMDPAVKPRGVGVLRKALR